ncbi:MAG TPA: hypothetical protein VKY59_16185 [Spirillospora sp.]|nr:hypothetical protein [Spirillospora sp.]
MQRKWFTLLLCVLSLARCTTNDPAALVESYLQAVIDDNTEQLAELVCAAREADALTAAASLRGTGASLQDMQCTVIEVDAAYQIVQCQGRIVVTYQGEQRELPLGRYRLILERDSWRVCGEIS